MRKLCKYHRKRQWHGIEEEHLPYIFQRFYRSDSARSSDIAGTGSGLAIVKSIVDLHGGSVTVTTDLNKGTSFSIVLPQMT